MDKFPLIFYFLPTQNKFIIILNFLLIFLQEGVNLEKRYWKANIQCIRVFPSR